MRLFAKMRGSMRTRGSAPRKRSTADFTHEAR